MDKLAIDGGKPVAPERVSLVKPTFYKKDEEDIAKILRSAYVRQGPYTKKFEEQFAEKVGAKYAYAVSNGTAALHVAYLSLLKPGDEVIAPAFTFIATISTVHYSFAKPVLADVDPSSYLLDPEAVKEKITKKTKALAPVHLFGNSCDMKALNELAEDHNLLIVNDCAQAHGTEYHGHDLGSYETLNCYSFYPTKTLTMGEGGIVTTNNEELYNRGCLLRSHGDDARYHHIIYGLNYRPTDISSAIGINQLDQLDNYLKARRHAGKALKQAMDKIDAVTPQTITPDSTPSYSYFTVKLKLEQLECTRDEFMKALQAENIDCGVHYPTALTQQPVIKELYPLQSCPISEDLATRILSLPMHPFLTEKELTYITDAVEKVAAHYHK
ncbi:DegT/DnrJ/EryC1/StrS family aminotransferase [Candidatus Bathyarchaeota archaeon]|nr:MAG: DegT/DnrJ/EryC1/StrS family aminotransferase [Candidatus Bathyarchaeota archaeon]